MKTCESCKHYETTGESAPSCKKIKSIADFNLDKESETTVRWCGCCNAIFSPSPDFGCILHEDK